MESGTTTTTSTTTTSLESKKSYPPNPSSARWATGHDEHIRSICPPHTTERALVRKTDLRILPVVVILYLMAFLDRVNISNALTLGLPAELGLVGNQTNIALTVFFVPYILFEIPSNILLKKFRPHVWLSLCMVIFGVVMTLQGVVHNFSGLVATRFFLGMAEAGVFPGCFYLLSMWYKRSESQRRFTIFFSSATFAGAFGSLLASAIQNMDGIAGNSGWRWIFLLEGIATCLLACVGFFLIPDFPEDSTWLREDEAIFMQARLLDDSKGEDGTLPSEPGSLSGELARFFKSPKTALGGLMYFGLTIPAYGLAYFTPTIVNTYGYSLIRTQLFSVPPSAAALVFAIILACISDWRRVRFPFVALALALAMVGAGVLINVHHNTPLEYGAICLIAMGTYSSMPLVICWFTMNLQGHWQRSVGTAWQIGFGNIGAIIATFAFVSTDAPFYSKGYAILMTGVCITAASALLYFVIIWRENRAAQHRISARSGEEALTGSDNALNIL